MTSSVFVVLCIVGALAVVHAQLPVAGPIHLFGKIGNQSEPFFLGSSVAGEHIGSVPFRAVGAGPIALGLLTEPKGQAAKMTNPFNNGTLSNYVEDPENANGFGFCQICKGVMHTVAVTCTGHVYTWGTRNPTVTDPDGPILPVSTPVLLDMGGERVAQIACGENHTLLLTEGRHVFAFGVTSYGRLGLDVANDPLLVNLTRVDYPLPLQSLSPAALNKPNTTEDEQDRVCFVQAGGKTSFAITEKGRMFSWGANEHGQLGLTFSSSLENPFVAAPTLVEQKEQPFVACEVAAGKEFALGYDDKGDVWTWGGAGVGETTQGPVRFGGANVTRHVLATLDTPAMMLAAGEFHVAILLENGEVLTFGYNRFGQLGVVLDNPLPIEEKQPGDPEPDSPIWTLEPRHVKLLEGLNISSIFAAGNYTVAQSFVKTPMNCPCARGGRKPTVFFHNGMAIPPKQPEKPKQPEREPSNLFAPVAPFASSTLNGRKRIETAPPLPGEVAHAAKPLTMDDFKPLGMGEVEGIEFRHELPARAATLYYYASDTPEAKVVEDGVEKGSDQNLFGRHITSDGYYYGDFDAEVSNPSYTRKAVMPAASATHNMPQQPKLATMATQGATGGSIPTSVASLSRVSVDSEPSLLDEMRTSVFDAVHDMEDTLAPVDFTTSVADEKATKLEDLDLIGTAAVTTAVNRRNMALQPVLAPTEM